MEGARRGRPSMATPAPPKCRELLFLAYYSLKHLPRFDEGIVVGDLLALLVDELAELELTK